jgi:anti-sigma B factor antagonist
MAVYVVEKIINDLMVLDVRGQITLGEETSVLREKTKSLMADGHTRIIVDLAEVNYIDSAGLATLVSLYTSARRQGGDVKLLRLTNRVRGLLQITRLSTVFEIYDDLEAAQKSFVNPSVP